MTEFDKEVVRAAVAVVDKWRSIGIQSSPSGWTECAALEKAVAAKREAERPKLAPYHEIIRAARDPQRLPAQNVDCEIIDQTRADVFRVFDRVVDRLSRDAGTNPAKHSIRDVGALIRSALKS